MLQSHVRALVVLGLGLGLGLANPHPNPNPHPNQVRALVVYDGVGRVMARSVIRLVLRSDTPVSRLYLAYISPISRLYLTMAHDSLARSASPQP